MGRLKICPNEHTYLKFYRVPPLGICSILTLDRQSLGQDRKIALHFNYIFVVRDTGVLPKGKGRGLGRHQLFSAPGDIHVLHNYQIEFHVTPSQHYRLFIVRKFFV